MKPAFLSLVLAGAACMLAGTGNAQGEPRIATKPDPSRFGVYLGSLRIDASSIFDSNIDHEVASREDYGMEIGGRLRIQSHRRHPLVRLEYRGGVEAYANSNRWDKVSHRLRGSLEGEPADGLFLEFFGELNRRTANEDRELVNQLTFSPGITVSGSSSRRLRLYAAFRSKRYVDVPDRDENIWYGGASARNGLWEDATIEGGYRYEVSDSDDPTESYVRHRLEVEFEQDIGRRNSLQMGLQYRIRNYSADLIDLQPGSELRKDRRWVPSVRLTHDLRGGRELMVDYEFQSRSSNDLDKEFEAHRIALALRWALVRS